MKDSPHRWSEGLALLAFLALVNGGLMAGEEQLTTGPYGHILTNTAVWSPDSRRIVYDVRSDVAGGLFDGTRIETVDVRTREVTVLYESARGAHCGVATYSPTENRVVFILGPEDPTPDWSYGPYHRQGVMVDEARPRIAAPLDARDVTRPFTPGALRGGTHVHVFSGDGRWVSFTYEDHVLAPFAEETADHEINLRTVGVTVPGPRVDVRGDHPRNHGADGFSVLVAQVAAKPRPGSDEIHKAFEDAWVGVDGYAKPDGRRQKRAIAFQGEIIAEDGRTLSEVFIVDIPEDVTVPGDGPLEGTATRRPLPPKGTVQRRLTFTAGRKHPGIQGPRHWLRSSPDGSQIAFLMKDDAGVVQLWTVSPNGGKPQQVTRNATDIASAFSWSPDGRRVAHVMDGSVCVTNVASGETTRLTPRAEDAMAPRPEACVFSPDGKMVTYVRTVPDGTRIFNQVFICATTE
jgi:hypothetical protein